MRRHTDDLGVSPSTKELASVEVCQRASQFEVFNEYDRMAIWAAQRADAKPFRLLVLLALLTAGLSAMLDNVTTMLLMAPASFRLLRL